MNLLFKKLFSYIKNNYAVLLLILLLVAFLNSIYFYTVIYQASHPEVVATFRHPKEGADQMVYFSLMRQASEGKNFLLNLYTNEKQTGMISPMWWALGKFSGVSGMSVETVYYVSLIAAAFVFLLIIYELSKKLFTSKLWQVFSLLVIALAGGVGWLFYDKLMSIPAEKLDFFNQILPVDLWYSEGFGFYVLQHSALFILSQLAIIFFIWFIAEKSDNANCLAKLGVGTLSLLLAVTHPYDSIIVFAFIIIYAILYKRHQLVNFILKQWPIVLGGVIGLSYFYFLRYFDPSFLGWSSQNVTKSPRLLSYLLGYCYIFPLSIVGGYIYYKDKNIRWRWLFAWLVTAVVLVLIPSNVQRRFGSGAYIPMSFLAVGGWQYIIKKFSNITQTTLSIILMTLLVSSAAVYLALNIRIIDLNSSLTFISKDQQQALIYYKNNSSDQAVILTPRNIGNVVPAITARKVYIGHGHQTVNWPEKKVFSDWFYATKDDEQEKYNQLKNRGIDFVWLDNSGLKDAKLFSLFFANDKVKIFKVNN